MQYQLQGELTKCHLGKIILQGELRSIKGYSFHVTKRPRMVIVVLPVSRNNYFILEGEYSGEMAPSMDIGSRQWACLSHQQEEVLMHGGLLCLSQLPASHFSQNVRITRRGNLVEQAKTKTQLLHS